MPKEVLSEEDLELIDGALTEFNELEELLNRARLAGIPVADQETRASRDRQQLQSIRDAFFPGRGPVQ